MSRGVVRHVLGGETRQVGRSLMPVKYWLVGAAWGGTEHQDGRFIKVIFRKREPQELRRRVISGHAPSGERSSSGSIRAHRSRFISRDIGNVDRSHLAAVVTQNNDVRGGSRPLTQRSACHEMHPRNRRTLLWSHSNFSSAIRCAAGLDEAIFVPRCPGGQQ
jgi:hypothetical protein